jgi:hypothetical protein
MRIDVERDGGGSDTGRPRRFRLDGRHVSVIENLDQWLGVDYAYFKVRGDDGNLYILRFDEVRDAWELTMFQRSSAEADATIRPLDQLHGNGEWRPELERKPR